MAQTSQASKDVVLRVAGISKRFGGLQALSDVGLTIERGQVYGLIGPNGAGKTTFFNVITGLYTPDAGSFELAGQPYEPRAVHLVAKAGIARTFQNIRLFAEMTALENVMVGRHIRTHSGLLGAIFRSASFKAEEAAIRARAQELLDYVGVGKYAEHDKAVDIAPDWDVWFRGKRLLDAVWPVGSIYLSASEISPETLFGGTWEQVKDRFLLAAGDVYSLGGTGGQASGLPGSISARSSATFKQAEKTRKNNGTRPFPTAAGRAPGRCTAGRPARLDARGFPAPHPLRR